MSFYKEETYTPEESLAFLEANYSSEFVLDSLNSTKDTLPSKVEILKAHASRNRNEIENLLYDNRAILVKTRRDSSRVIRDIQSLSSTYNAICSFSKSWSKPKSESEDKKPDSSSQKDQESTRNLIQNAPGNIASTLNEFISLVKATEKKQDFPSLVNSLVSLKDIKSKTQPNTPVYSFLEKLEKRVESRLLDGEICAKIIGTKEPLEILQSTLQKNLAILLSKDLSQREKTMELYFGELAYSVAAKHLSKIGVTSRMNKDYYIDAIMSYSQGMQMALSVSNHCGIRLPITHDRIQPLYSSFKRTLWDLVTKFLGTSDDSIFTFADKLVQKDIDTFTSEEILFAVSQRLPTIRKQASNKIRLFLRNYYLLNDAEGFALLFVNMKVMSKMLEADPIQLTTVQRIIGSNDLLKLFFVNLGQLILLFDSFQASGTLKPSELIESVVKDTEKFLGEGNEDAQEDLRRVLTQLSSFLSKVFSPEPIKEEDGFEI